MKHLRIFINISLLLLAACQQPAGKAGSAQADGPAVKASTRIVSLNGTLTEILCDFGYEQNIVGVDVTSTYPESIAAKPKVGHNRNLSAESIIALKPDVVVGVKEFMKPELVQQLAATGARVMIFDPQHSVEGAKALIHTVADSFHYAGDIQSKLAAIDADKAATKPLPVKPKVLFIYARGAGTLMASGTATPVHNAIALAGAQNAVTGYENFKPLTSEALVSANPDVILLFSSGLASLGGVDGLLAIPGVAQTAAGKSKRVVEMDGQLLTGFGPRTGKAIAMLAQKLDEAISH